MKKVAFSRDGLPQSFIDRFGQHVTGFLSGFDRLRFRATLRPLFQPGGMEIYLCSCKVLIKQFGAFAKGLTEQIRQAAYASFEQAKRPIRYLTDSSLSKEELARRLAQEAASRGSSGQEVTGGIGTFQVHPSAPLLSTRPIGSAPCARADLVSF